jgi:hypothetical protein
MPDLRVRRCRRRCNNHRLWRRDEAAAMNIATTLRWFLMHACWHPKFRSSADQERLQQAAAAAACRC